MPVLKRPLLTLLLVDDIHAGTMRLVDFAETLGHPWQALHVAVDPEKTARIQQKWQRQFDETAELTILPSPYRSISGPLRNFILQKQRERPDLFIHLLVGQLALPSYWEQALHRNTNLLVDLVLRDIDRVAITSVPYQINQRERLLARQAQTDGAD